MSLLKWFVFALILLAACLSLYAYTIFQEINPVLEGEIKVGELKSPVRIVRDIYAIPHIYAENDHDLLLAQGYVTAQDRLWQMDLSRRIATGRLSEILGQSTVEIDYFLRTLLIEEIAERIYGNLDRKNREELMAYSSGVNHYINSGKKTVESVILRYDIEPWNPVDSIAIHLFSAFDLSINMDEEIFALKVERRLGDKAVKELLPHYPENGNTIIPEEIKNLKLNLDLPLGYKMAKERFGLFQAKGASNNWVIDGTKSESGKPILANDPHLRIQIPSVWHQVHLTAPGIKVIGAAFPGSPYVLIGHNDKVAWGFTDAMADRVDLFIERLNPDDSSQYRYLDHWEDVSTKRVEIRFKDKGSDRAITREIKRTRHGPIINPIEGHKEEALSLMWSGAVVKDQSLEGISVLNRARSVEEAKEGRKYAKIYTLNMVYADVYGNMGYQLIGGIPIRGEKIASPRHTLAGRIPVPGWTGEYEWKGFIPDEDLPGISDPPSHFIATANNKIVGRSFPYLISNTWAPPYRYERIDSLLHTKGKLSTRDFQKMQADVFSIPAQGFVAEVLKIKTDDQDSKWVLKQLSDWDHELAPDSLPALLYEVTRANLTRNALEDELGELYSDFLSTLNFNYNLIDKIISDPRSSWWDDVNTPERETRDQIIMRSMKDALREIEEKLGISKETWKWGQIHRYRFKHPLGSLKLLGKLLNPKPIPASGDRDTLNNSYFGYKRHYYRDKESYDATSIPTYRFIVDLADMDHALAMNSTGQWGNPFSKHYSDLVPGWARVEYHPLLFNDADIEKNKWKELRLSPDYSLHRQPK